MTTTPTPAELAMARAILAEMEPAEEGSNWTATLEATNHERWRTALRYAVAAEKARPVGEVPEGWVLVPREPSETMRQAVYDRYAPSFPDGPELIDGWVEAAVENYGLLLSAAPSPPEGLGNKGFMADREVEKPTPVASDATPELVWRICPYLRSPTHDCKRCPPTRLIGGDLCVPGCFALAREAVNIAQTGNAWRCAADGSLESQEKAPETTQSEMDK